MGYSGSMRFLTLLVCLLMLFALPAATLAQYESGSSNRSEKEERQMLAKLETEQKKAEADLKKSPQNAKVKERFVVATVRLGTATMVSPILDRKEKYRIAIGYYRAALKVDPNNKEAKNNSKLIEDIYRSMGRPIPK
jgi:cytochrome c-type biogenesis protein CcmH/NrfG